MTLFDDVQNEINKREKALAMTVEDYPDWCEGDILDAVGTTSAYTDYSKIRNTYLSHLRTLEA